MVRETSRRERAGVRGEGWILEEGFTAVRGVRRCWRTPPCENIRDDVEAMEAWRER